MTEFLEMGGYGLWVWLCYGITAVGLGGLALETRLSAARARKQVESLKAARKFTAGQP